VVGTPAWRSAFGLQALGEERLAAIGAPLGALDDLAEVLGQLLIACLLGILGTATSRCSGRGRREIKPDVGAAPKPLGSYTQRRMPTTRPRYTLTDAGELAEMLDIAQRRWPDEPRRQNLLVRLAALGCAQVEGELTERNQETRRARQSEALERFPRLVDVEALLSDAAWR